MTKSLTQGHSAPTRSQECLTSSSPLLCPVPPWEPRQSSQATIEQVTTAVSVCGMKGPSTIRKEKAHTALHAGLWTSPSCLLRHSSLHPHPRLQSHQEEVVHGSVLHRSSSGSLEMLKILESLLPHQ